GKSREDNAAAVKINVRMLNVDRALGRSAGRIGIHERANTGVGLPHEELSPGSLPNHNGVLWPPSVIKTPSDIENGRSLRREGLEGYQAPEKKGGKKGGKKRGKKTRPRCPGDPNGERHGVSP